MIADEIFHRIRTDLERLVLPLEVGAPIAGAYGEGVPEINDEMLHFRGLRNGGYPPNDEIDVLY